MAVHESLINAKKYIAQCVHAFGPSLTTFVPESVFLPGDDPHVLLRKELLEFILGRPEFSIDVPKRATLDYIVGFDTLVRPSAVGSEYPQLLVVDANLIFTVPQHTPEYLMEFEKKTDKLVKKNNLVSFVDKAPVYKRRFVQLPVLALELVTGVPGECVGFVCLPPYETDVISVRWYHHFSGQKKDDYFPSIPAFGGLSIENLQNKSPNFKRALDALLDSVATPKTA